MNAKHLGSDFDDFLRKEDMLDEAEAVGLKRVLAHQVRHVKNQGGRVKTAKARRLGARHPTRRRQPTHPAKILREDVLPALNLSVAEAARQLRVSRQTLPDNKPDHGSGDAKKQNNASGKRGDFPARQQVEQAPGAEQKGLHD